MADNGEEGDDNGITYFVDEDGRYYYQPAGQGQGLVSLPSGNEETEAEPPMEDPMMVSEATENDNYQTVTLVPSESNGEVSYVLVVQEETKPNVNNIDIKVDVEDKNDVYIFEEEEVGDNASEEEVDEPTKKKRAKRALFTCNFCTYTSHRRYLLLRHLKAHSDERPHKCVVCERGFKTVASLQNHVNMHNGVKPHVCKYCNSPFTTSGELVRHVRYKHTHEKPHKCTECDYASVELSKLRRHIRCHTGERPFQCQHCTYASPDTFKLKRHLRTHTGEKPYKCDQCSMCFTQSNSLKAHRRIHNVAEKPVYQCELCPAKCGRKTDLRIHVQKLHTSDKPLECKRCGKSFPDRYSCKVHNKTHEGEKCFKCQLCPYASTTSRHLKTHLLKHTDEKPFSCDLCDQSFRQKQLLRRHYNLYHNPDYVPKPPKEKTHSCHGCNRTFAHKGNLIRHLAIHDPESGHQERALALKLGRQKKVKYIDAKTLEKMKPKSDTTQPGSVVKVLPGAGDKRRELVTVSDGDGQQYVVLEVIQLEDGTEQQVAVVAPNYNPTEDDDEEEEEEDPEEEDEEEEDDDDDDDDDDDGEDEIILPEMKKTTPAERSVKLEQEVDACFGFEEENEDEEEGFGERVVYQLV